MTKSFLIIAIATLITIIAWVGFDVYYKRQKTQISTDVQSLIEPIETGFDLSGVK